MDQQPQTQPFRVTAVTVPAAVLARELRQHALYGDVKKFYGVIVSDRFGQAFANFTPAQRKAIMRAYAEASETCERNSRTPLVKRKLLAGRSLKSLTNWRDPAMLARLAKAYARGDDHEAAGRFLGVTPDAARLARRRYLDATATGHAPQGP